MAILERHVQRIINQDLYMEWEKKLADVEKRLGGDRPTKKYYYLVSGADFTGTIVWQREWESHAVMDAAYDEFWKTPESQEFMKHYREIFVGERTEYYGVLAG
jgi:hypothetical protein